MSTLGVFSAFVRSGDDFFSTKLLEEDEDDLLSTTPLPLLDTTPGPVVRLLPALWDDVRRLVSLSLFLGHSEPSRTGALESLLYSHEAFFDNDEDEDEDEEVFRLDDDVDDDLDELC